MSDAVRPRTSPWPVTSGSLVLRRVEEHDVEELLSFRNDPDVNRFMVHTHVDPETMRRDWTATRDSATDHSCVVERDGRLVAIGFLEVVDGPGQPGTPGGTDGLIGYIVRPDAAGRGVATAMARALLDAAFGHLGLRRVTAGAYADNAASVRVLERAGMRRERHEVAALWHAELGWLDEVGYALLREEWLAAR